MGRQKPGIFTDPWIQLMFMVYMGVSVNGGTPRSSILIGFSIMNHPFWGTPIFGNTHMYRYNKPFVPWIHHGKG